MAKNKMSITLDSGDAREIRLLQSKLIEATDKNWSFSEVLGLAVSSGLKKIRSQKLESLKKSGRKSQKNS